MNTPVGMPAVSDSQFYMWRTVFALAHADFEVSEGEVKMMAKVLEDIPFSYEQKEILKGDITTPQDVTQMFEGISDQKDQAQFFSFARELVWADGDFSKNEQELMMKLQSMHLKNVNVDHLVGSIDLEFEGGGQVSASTQHAERPDFSGSPVEDHVYSFRTRFLKSLEKDNEN